MKFSIILRLTVIFTALFLTVLSMLTLPVSTIETRAQRRVERSPVDRGRGMGDRRQPFVGTSDAKVIAAMAPAAAPPPPPGCVQTPAQSFTNSAAVPIPDNQGAATSQIVVSGVYPHLSDVDVTTAISHTLPDDLQVTVTSPAGTVVSLTTGNGLGNDNVFNGTTWDDDADPDGVATADPFLANPNQVQTQNYQNGVVATPLSPEEPLAAFIGEDPNGTWVITVADTATGADPGIGTLNSWGLTFRTFLGPQPTSAPVVSAVNSTAQPISSGAASVITSTVPVAAPGVWIQKVTVNTNITHTFTSDLQFTLTSPSGTVVTLSNGIWETGIASDNVYAGTLWDDDADPNGLVPYFTNPNNGADHPYANLVVATPLTPVEGLGAFIGENPNGTWTLTVADQFAAEGGSLNSWGVNVTTAVCSPTAADVTVGGHVRTSESGRGLRNARVYLTDANGATRTAVTGRFGEYSFEEVESGAVYTLSVSSRRYVFAPRVIEITDTLSDVDFIPEEASRMNRRR